VLKLHDLVYYGIVIVSPIAAVPIFGVTEALSRGHAVTTILLAGVAMLLTAFSYGRMAALYPSAGSAYSYVGRGLNPHLGFLAGWAMSIDYVVVPMIAVLQATLAVERFVPQIPYAVWAGLFAAFMTALNLRGIRTTARTNAALLVCMFAVIGVFVTLAIRYLFQLQGWHGLVSVQPFYDPRTFDFRAIAGATSFAALTYIGFDGVTTLAEDVENPRRSMLLATVLVCLFTVVAGGFEVYLAQRVWPDFRTYPNVETAFMDVSRRVGGPLLFHAMGTIIIVSMVGCGISGQVAAARLLFGMGRDNVLPRKVFGYLDPVRNNPTFNILIIGLLAFVGALLLRLEQAGELINFGAFLAFMGVNLATLRQFYFSRATPGKRRLFADAVAPILGFLFCLAIWSSLPRLAKTVGGVWLLVGVVWLLVGVVYAAYRTRGFRSAPVMIDFEEA
jgi:putrescine importer